MSKQQENSTKTIGIMMLITLLGKVLGSSNGELVKKYVVASHSSPPPQHTNTYTRICWDSFLVPGGGHPLLCWGNSVEE